MTDTKRLRDDLQLAAETLRSYEAHHRAKGTMDSMKKAEKNAALAARFEETLAATKSRLSPAAAWPFPVKEPRATASPEDGGLTQCDMHEDESL